MTRTVDVEMPEHGSTPSSRISPDVAAGSENYNPSTSDPNVYNKHNQNFENESSKQKTNEMTNIMDDLSLNSPKERLSRSRSRTQSSRHKSSRSSSSSSSSSDSSSSSAHSSWSRSRSYSRDRKYRYRRSRRHSRSYSSGRSRSYSRSYSRSRSRSYSPRQRRRYSSAYRRYYRSPPRYRSRSRSYSRSYRRSRYSRSRSRSRGRRYYGFVRRHYSPTYQNWRSRSRSRSHGRTLHLSKKEKLELLEIAKRNASKILGKQVELPESVKQNLEQLKSSTEKDEQKSDKLRSGSSISRNSERLLQEEGTSAEVQTETKNKSPYMLWRPVTHEPKSFSKSLSPKEAHKSRNR